MTNSYPKTLFLYVLACIAIGVIPVSTQCMERHRRHRNCNLLPRDDQCGVVRVSQRVVGGHDATLGQFPWIAILTLATPGSNDFGSVICGGSVINERYVVSAAHCIPEIETLRIRLGEHKLSTEVDCSANETEVCSPRAQNFEVEKITIHANYNNRTVENDIALIRLKEELAYSKYIQPICLPVDRSFRRTGSLRGKLFDIAGWGVSLQEGGEDTAPDVLQTVTIPHVPKRQCEKAYNRKLSSVKVCAGGMDGRDACMGDSGGPLMGQFSPRGTRNRYFLVGIVSFGSPACGQGPLPGVYANVAEFITWLLDTIY